MERRKKIVIVGAGSAQFVEGLFGDLIRSGRPWELSLVDIDPSALAIAEGLSRRMVEAKQADIVIRGSLDRRDVLPGANVVVLTVGVGGRRAWEADVHVPRRFGVYQPVGDTIMPGGISRAMRMIPALIDIARDVRRLCPRALFINYSNPMTVNCQAVRKAIRVEMVGLCIGTYHVQQNLARFIGAPEGEVTSLAAGVNHFTWVYDLRWNGQDAWPLVREKLARVRAGKETDPFVDRNRFSWQLFDSYGAYPAVNDVHVVEFFPERFPEGNYYGQKLGLGGCLDFDQHIARIDRTYERMAGVAQGTIPIDDSVFQSSLSEHSQLVRMILDIERDNRRSYTANLLNRGLVPNLHSEAVLEVTAVTTARGFRGLQHPDFPYALAGALDKTLVVQQLTVEAALTGSRKLFVEAILADGAVKDHATAEQLTDALIARHREHLPQFA